MNFGKSMHLKDITILIYSVSSTQNVIIISKNVYIMEDYYHNIVIILNQDEVHIALQQSNVAKCDCSNRFHKQWPNIQWFLYPIMLLIYSIHHPRPILLLCKEYNLA